MLPLVVGCSAPINLVAIERYGPWVAVFFPLAFHAKHNIAVAVTEYGRKVFIFDAGCQQNRAAAVKGIVVNLRLKAQGLEAWHHLLFQVFVECRNLVRVLAL